MKIGQKEKLLILREQGIGEEILFSSVYQDIIEKFQNVIIEADKRLVSVFNRSFQNDIFVEDGYYSKNSKISEFDNVVYAGSIIKFFRKRKSDFTNSNYLIARNDIIDKYKKSDKNLLLIKVDKDRLFSGSAFVFFTNFGSQKALEIFDCGKASFVWHSKFLRRQIRVRGFTSVECDQASDEYYNSRSLRSRLGAWASLQSKPLDSRETLLNQVEKFSESLGQEPTRPKFWGGFRIVPAEIEFWAEGESRLHDRFLWTKSSVDGPWNIQRLYP